MDDDIEHRIPKTGGFVPPREHRPWHEKYLTALKIMIPWSRRSKTSNDLPLENSGCFNYFTVGWITGYMVKAFRSGLGFTDLFRLSANDESKDTASRLQRLWDEEQETAKKSNREPSLARAVFHFCKSRICLSVFFFSLSVTLQFLAPSVVLKMILEYISDPSRNETEGWQLLMLLAFMLMLRLTFFTFNFNVGLQTATRLSGATQYLGFSKLLRLSNPTDQALGQLVTCCTSDQERITEGVIVTVLFFGK